MMLYCCCYRSNLLHVMASFRVLESLYIDDSYVMFMLSCLLLLLWCFSFSVWPYSLILSFVAGSILQSEVLLGGNKQHESSSSNALILGFVYPMFVLTLVVFPAIPPLCLFQGTSKEPAFLLSSVDTGASHSLCLNSLLNAWLPLESLSQKLMVVYSTYLRAVWIY